LPKTITHFIPNIASLQHYYYDDNPVFSSQPKPRNKKQIAKNKRTSFEKKLPNESNTSSIPKKQIVLFNNIIIIAPILFHILFHHHAALSFLFALKN